MLLVTVSADYREMNIPRTDPAAMSMLMSMTCSPERPPHRKVAYGSIGKTDRRHKTPGDKGTVRAGVPKDVGRRQV
jgi:hypothetical protein